MSDKKLKDTGFALACWILVALILLVFFFVKKDTIVSNLRHTNFVNRVMGKASDDEEKGLAVQAEDEDEERDDDGSEGEADNRDISDVKSKNGGNDTDVSIVLGGESENTEENKASVSTMQDDTALKQSAGSEAEIRKDEAAEEKNALKPMKKPIIDEGGIKEAVPMMTVKLCFVTIDNDGAVSRVIKDKSLPKTSSPLTASIKALLSGAPSGAQTLIPEGTRLLSAEVRNSVATLNFSEEFAFNPFGVEGYMAQLMQVVYTATSFSTVNSVQFIINGQKVDYLGSEGEWIGSPLSRASFH